MFLDICQVIRMRFFILSCCFLFFFSNITFSQENTYSNWQLTPKEKKIHQRFQKYLQEQEYEKGKNYLMGKKKEIQSLLFYRRQLLEVLFLQKKERELLNLATKWITENKIPNYLFLRGLFLYRLHYQLSAFEDLNQAYKQNGKTSKIVEFLYFYYQSIQHTAALQTTAYTLLEQILQLQSIDYIWFEKAKLEIRQKKYEQSYQSLMQAIQLVPKKEYYNKLLELEQFFYPQKYPASLLTLLQKYPNDISYYNLYSDLQKTTTQKQSWENKLKSIIEKKEQQNEPNLVNFYLMLANLQKELKKETALENYRKAAKKEPSNSIILALAEELWHQDQRVKAIKYFHQLYEKGEQDIWIFYALGTYYKEKNQPYSAEEFVLSGLELFPENSTLLYLYLQILEIQSRYFIAIEVIEELLKIETDHPDLLRKIGFFHTKLQNYQKAKTYLKKSLAIQENDLSYYQLASIYYEQQDEQAALKTLERNFQDINLLPFIYSLKAEIYFNQEKYQESLIAIQKTIQYKKEQQEQITNFSKNLEIRNLIYLENFNLASKKIENYKSQGISDFLKEQELILKFIAQKESPKKLLSKIQDYLQTGAQSSLLIEMLYYLQEGENYLWNWQQNEKKVYRKILFYQLQEAEKLLINLPERSQKIFLRYLLLKIKDQPVNLDGAKATNFWHSYYFAKYYLQKTELEKASIFIQKAITQKPDFAWNYLLQGIIQQNQKNYPQAIIAYQKFLEYFPIHLPALRNLAISYDFSQKSEEAKKIYLRIIQNYPTEELALNNLAWLYLTKFSTEQNHKEALQLSQKAVQIHANSANLDTLAEAHYQNGNYTEALRLIEQSMILDNENLDHFKQQKIKFLKALNQQKTSP